MSLSELTAMLLATNDAAGRNVLTHCLATAPAVTKVSQAWLGLISRADVMYSQFEFASQVVLEHAATKLDKKSRHSMYLNASGCKIPAWKAVDAKDLSKEAFAIVQVGQG